MLNVGLLVKGLEIVFPPHFVYDFSRKMFSCYILLTERFLLPDLLPEILGNMCTAIVCFPGCNVINFEIDLIFLIKPFFYMTKMLRLELNILRTERAFKVK